MAVRIINKSWYIDIRYDRRRYRFKSPENSRAGALAYEAQLRHKMARGEPVNKGREVTVGSPIFADFTKKWFKDYVVVNNKHSEIRQKRLILKKHLIPFFGKSPLDKITNRKIEEYKAMKQRQKKLALKSVNNHLAILSKCLHTAKKWELLDKTPFIELFKIAPQKFDYLSVAESRQLLDAAHGVYYEMILVALKTGLRLGEITALDWSDLNFQNKCLTVRQSLVRDQLVSPKSNKIRYVPLTGEVSLALSQRAKKKGYVFTSSRGKPFRAECARRTLHRICVKAGLRNVGWHTLRHTFASHLAEAGASIISIQKLLGHSDIKTTMRYAHLSASALNETIKLLEPDRLYEIIGHYMGTDKNLVPELIEVKEKINRNYSLI